MNARRIPIKIPFCRSSPTFRIEVSIDSDEVLYPRGVHMECPQSAGLVLSSVMGPNRINQIIGHTDLISGVLVSAFFDRVVPVDWPGFGGYQNNLPSPMSMTFHGLPFSDGVSEVSGVLKINLFINRCDDFDKHLKLELDNPPKCKELDNPPKCKVRLEFGYDVAMVRDLAV